MARVAFLAPVMLGHSVAIPDELLGVAIMVPSQWRARGGRPDGARALLMRLLADAINHAALGPRMRRKGSAPRTGPGRVTRAHAAAARQWLLGELDDQVALPVRWVCDMLGIDADALAAAVRARATVVVASTVSVMGVRGGARDRGGDPTRSRDEVDATRAGGVTGVGADGEPDRCPRGAAVLAGVGVPAPPRPRGAPRTATRRPHTPRDDTGHVTRRTAERVTS